jgi:hypothetical protein
MYAPGTPVKYRRRHFVVVAMSKDGKKVTLRDDEGEYLTVYTSQVSPA